MANLTRGQTAALLTELGWRVRGRADLEAAVRNFQRGWALGAALTVDGVVGPGTSNALRGSVKRKRAGQSTASPHFSFSEVACKCGGRYPSCPRVWMTRETFSAMEAYRARKGSGFRPVSGCRCPGHNRRVGGASQSQHLRGNAFDPPAEVDKDTVRSWHIASGIGYDRSSDRVAHLDVRAGSRSRPTTWVYQR